MECFQLFFNDLIVHGIVARSNVTINKRVKIVLIKRNITSEELKAFLGVGIAMAFVELPKC